VPPEELKAAQTRYKKMQTVSAFIYDPWPTTEEQWNGFPQRPKLAPVFMKKITQAKVREANTSTPRVDVADTSGVDFAFLAGWVFSSRHLLKLASLPFCSSLAFSLK
jgi:hypothetical protein